MVPWSPQTVETCVENYPQKLWNWFNILLVNKQDPYASYIKNCSTGQHKSMILCLLERINKKAGTNGIPFVLVVIERTNI